MLTTLAAFLAPCLPFLWEKVGAPALDSAASQIGKDTWDRAQAVWKKLFPKIEQDAAAQVVAAELAKNPESEIWQAAFQEKLQALLESDEALKQAIADILENDSSSAGTRIQITANQNKGQIIGQMVNSEAKQIGSVENIQGDINF